MSYRNLETKKVRQEDRYLQEEVDVNGERSVKPPVDRKSMRRVLNSGPYIMYRVDEDHWFIRQYEDGFYGSRR